MKNKYLKFQVGSATSVEGFSCCCFFSAMKSMMKNDLWKNISEFAAVLLSLMTDSSAQLAFVVWWFFMTVTDAYTAKRMKSLFFRERLKRLEALRNVVLFVLWKGKVSHIKTLSLLFSWGWHCKGRNGLREPLYGAETSLCFRCVFATAHNSGLFRWKICAVWRRRVRITTFSEAGKR